MQKATQPTRISDIKRKRHVIDVKDKVLGRISGNIAHLLMGKGKPYFAKNMDCGDYVVVINAKEVNVTGNKEKNKVYSRYSGYPGGIRRETLAELRARKPEEIIRHAVSGMLPKNKLHDKMLKRLYVYAYENHPYGKKIKDQKSNIKDAE